ncbi:unnamed protein product, partial [Amoebophrya sp. A120]|eukprot:GSA120T00005155001.1
MAPISESPRDEPDVATTDIMNPEMKLRAFSFAERVTTCLSKTWLTDPLAQHNNIDVRFAFFSGGKPNLSSSDGGAESKTNESEDGETSSNADARGDAENAISTALEMLSTRKVEDILRDEHQLVEPGSEKSKSLGSLADEILSVLTTEDAVAHNVAGAGSLPVQSPKPFPADHLSIEDTTTMPRMRDQTKSAVSRVQSLA